MRVNVIGITEAGKISLSLKKAMAEENPGEELESRKSRQKQNKPRSKPNIYEPKKSIPQSEMTFEDMMSHFKQTSEERISDSRHRTDRKTGYRKK